jgi:DNA-binding CsgD family transcriptional regulator
MRSQYPVGAVPAERVRLTARERDVLRRVLCGYSVKEIATSLGITKLSADQYVRKLRAALGLRTRAELQSWASTDEHRRALLGDWVERRFHRPNLLPDCPEPQCPCTWCVSLRAGLLAKTA